MNYTNSPLGIFRQTCVSAIKIFIWTVILCGIFLSGLVMWIVLYPRLKRQFSRARSDSDEYHAFSERVLQNHEESYGDSGIRRDYDDEASYSYLSD